MTRGRWAGKGGDEAGWSAVPARPGWVHAGRDQPLTGLACRGWKKTAGLSQCWVTRMSGSLVGEGSTWAMPSWETVTQVCGRG